MQEAIEQKRKLQRLRDKLLRNGMPLAICETEFAEYDQLSHRHAKVLGLVITPDRLSDKVDNDAEVL